MIALCPLVSVLAALFLAVSAQELTCSCPPGAYCPAPGVMYPCPAGRYGSSWNATTAACDGECARGFMCTEYSVSPYQQPCPSGQYNNESGGPCLPCSPGFWAQSSVNGTLQCNACAAGTYAPMVGSAACLMCAAGTFASSAGAATCMPCPLNMFAEYGQAHCKPCEDGFCAPIAGMSSCIPCDTSSDTSSPIAQRLFSMYIIVGIIGAALIITLTYLLYTICWYKPLRNNQDNLIVDDALLYEINRN